MPFGGAVAFLFTFSGLAEPEVVVVVVV